MQDSKRTASTLGCILVCDQKLAKAQVGRNSIHVDTTNAENVMSLSDVSDVVLQLLPGNI